MAVDPLSVALAIGVSIVGGAIRSGQRQGARRREILDNIAARDIYYERQMVSWRDQTFKQEEAHAQFYGAKRGQAERVAIAQLGDAMRRKGEFQLQAQEYAFGTIAREASQIGGSRDFRGYATSGALVTSGSALARLAMTRSVGAEGVRRLEAQAAFAEKRGLLAAAMTRESVIEPMLVLDPEPVKEPVPGEGTVTPSSVADGGGDTAATAEVLLDPEGKPETAIRRESRLRQETSLEETKVANAKSASKAQYNTLVREEEATSGGPLTQSQKRGLGRSAEVDSEDLWMAKQLQSSIIHQHKDTDESGFGEPPPTGIVWGLTQFTAALTGALSAVSGGLISKYESPQYEREYMDEIQYADLSVYDPLAGESIGANQPGFRPVSEGTRIRRELGLLDANRGSRGLALLNRLGASDVKRIYERLTKGGGSWSAGGSLGHKTSDISADWDVIAAAEELGIDILNKGDKFDTQLENKARYEATKAGKISHTFADEDLARKMGWIQPDPAVPNYWVHVSTLDQDDPLHPDAIKKANLEALELARKAEEEAILGYDPDLLGGVGEQPLTGEWAEKEPVEALTAPGLIPSQTLSMAGEIAEAEAIFEHQYKNITSTPAIVQEDPLSLSYDLASAMEDEILADLELEAFGLAGTSAFDESARIETEEVTEETDDDELLVDRGATGRSALQPVKTMKALITTASSESLASSIEAEIRENQAAAEKVESVTKKPPASTKTIGGVLKPYVSPTTTSTQPLAGSLDFDEWAGTSATMTPKPKPTPKPKKSVWAPQVFDTYDYNPYGGDMYDY